MAHTDMLIDRLGRDPALRAALREVYALHTGDEQALARALKDCVYAEIARQELAREGYSPMTPEEADELAEDGDRKPEQIIRRVRFGLAEVSWSEFAARARELVKAP